MGKANDKKVVRETRDLLLRSIGNLLESHRERRYTYAQRPTPYPEDCFAAERTLLSQQYLILKPEDSSVLGSVN